jgi:uracil-DNA glycosylase family 4
MSDPPFPDPQRRCVVDAGCTRCPALVESRNRIAWGVGPDDADVVVIGEAPAAGDPDAERWQGGNHTGLAYTSRHSGRRIRQLFDELGYGDRTYYTNAVKCFPRAEPTADDRPEGGQPTNRQPTADERDNCRSHLVTELDAIDPTVIVPTGKHATASVLAIDGRTLDGFLDRVLEPVVLSALDVLAVPILHPSYQNVWLARLGYDEQEYRAQLAAQLPE